MSANKEAVLSEKELSVGFGCTVVTSYSALIAPTDHAAFEGFMGAVQAAWDREWLDTMSAEAEGARGPGGGGLGPAAPGGLGARRRGG
jgi:hypothetical protein